MERRISRLVEEQWGVVCRVQLLAAGVSGTTIDRLIASGWLRVIHRGVYAVGHAALRNEGRCLAALLAVGNGAVLSHFSAAELWDFGLPSRTRVHVTTSSRAGRAQPEISVHRTRRLADDEICSRRGLPCTTVARTIVDLADVLPVKDLERAIEAAETKGVLDIAELIEGYDRAVGRRGRKRLGRALSEYRPRGRTRSRMEQRFLRLCRRHGLPEPRVNAKVHGYEVDFSWPDEEVAVETDSWEFHRSRAAFGRDRRRDARLTAKGWAVMRVTWARIDDESAEVAAELRAVLDDRRRR